MSLHNIKQNKTLVALVLLFLVGIAFRFWLLGASPFKADTMNFYQAVLRGQSIIELWRNPPWTNQIPLGETLSLLLVKAGLPATPFVVRLPFALMGCLTLFFIWKFASRWFGLGASMMVLLLAVFNPYELYFSRASYYYSGVVCWSSAMFLAFWSILETLNKKEMPDKTQLLGWFLSSIAAGHMHMSAWIVVGLQGLLLFTFGFRLNEKERRRIFVRLLTGGILMGIVMSRWIFRAIKMTLDVSCGEAQQIGSNAASEFLRLLPAYFAGENIFAVVLLIVFVALAIAALFGSSESVRRYRSLAWICILHIAVLMLYVGLVGGGIAKISYFSAAWAPIILLIGIGSIMGIQRLASRLSRTGLYVFLAVGYIAVTAYPDWAIIHLEGKPTPFYKINNWVQKNLPPGTPILTDRWFEPWNELAVHNPGGINYAFTVPDEPIENYKRFNWPKTVEQFYEKYPEAAFLEVARGRFEKELGPWNFPQRYFARTVSITNESAMILRQWKVFPEMDYAAANTNRVVTQIFYNTPEDLVDAARKNGHDVLRLYGEGWGYAKPGWQQGHFEDYRILGQAASIDIYDLKDIPLKGSLEISAATAERPKTLSVNGATTVFASGRIRTWTVPLTLQPGKNTIPFTSPSGDPLFVLDIRWKP